MSDAIEQTERENLVIDLLEKADPKGWLVIMRWCATKMAAENQRLLAELICIESQRRSSKLAKSVKPSDCIFSVLHDLGLKIVAEQP